MTGQLIDRAFVRSDIGVVRHQVALGVAAAGLTGHRRDGFILAVNEIVTNVVLHAGGRGRVRLTLSPVALRCTVADHGCGIPEKYLAGQRLPAARAGGGRGLWLAHRLCDAVTINTGATGTTVELRVDLPDGESARHAGPGHPPGHESPTVRTMGACGLAVAPSG
jgi:anti-sigma regulatory factor (Ser/Thr protein kinase)